jgi:DNA-binding MarR family transcriptional regulator
MSAVDAAKIWSLNYRVLLSVISRAEDEICSLGLESKELFLLAEIEEHPYPAELATTLNMPKATVTVYLKRLEAAGFVRREIDPSDLRRHRLLLTATGKTCSKKSSDCRFTPRIVTPTGADLSGFSSRRFAARIVARLR